MKKISTFIILFFSALNLYSQNVHIEIDGKLSESEGYKYYIYQFANASYSATRATIIFVSNADFFKKTRLGIPELYNAKQEFTDIWYLGIEDFDSNKITEKDKKIIDLLYDDIIQYRDCNNLYEYEKEQLQGLTFFLYEDNDMCKYLSCNTRESKKKEKEIIMGSPR